jgi:hypothetical protein
MFGRKLTQTIWVLIWIFLVPYTLRGIFDLLAAPYEMFTMIAFGGGLGVLGMRVIVTIRLSHEFRNSEDSGAVEKLRHS